MNNREQNHICIRVKLVAKREGTYDTYVFEDLDQDDSYIMCTRCFNWEGTEPDLFQEGYLSYAFVCAGIDTWYDKLNDTFHKYAYSANYFMDFVPVTHVLNDGRVVESDSFIIG